MSEPPSAATPRSPQLDEILSAIRGYSNGVTFDNGPGERAGPALALLKIAMRATMELERVVQATREFPGAFDDVAEIYAEAAPKLFFWPVPFNEVAELTPYKSLRIGYDLIPPKSPRKRTGKTVFAYYARVLLERLLSLRDDCLSAPGATADARKSEHQRFVSLVEELNTSAGPQSWVILQRHEPTWTSEIARLPTFSTSSAHEWKELAKRFFQEAIPNPEQILDLANEINDADVTYESQIKAQIVERVGRAVVALAPESCDFSAPQA